MWEIYKIVEKMIFWGQIFNSQHHISRPLVAYLGVMFYGKYQLSIINHILSKTKQIEMIGVYS